MSRNCGRDIERSSLSLAGQGRGKTERGGLAVILSQERGGGPCADCLNKDEGEDEKPEEIR